MHRVRVTVAMPWSLLKTRMGALFVMIAHKRGALLPFLDVNLVPQLMLRDDRGLVTGHPLYVLPKHPELLSPRRHEREEGATAVSGRRLLPRASLTQRLAAASAIAVSSGSRPKPFPSVDLPGFALALRQTRSYVNAGFVLTRFRRTAIGPPRDLFCRRVDRSLLCCWAG